MSTPGSSVAVDITQEGTHILTFYSRDVDENIESPNEVTFGIDKTPPEITITTPADVATYQINAIVVADYVVTDTGSGVATTVASLPQGNTIDMSTTGSYTFTVTSNDIAGNSKSVTHSFTVAYPGNIDPDNTGAHYAYGENIGWINFKPSFGPGVNITDSAVTGYAWGENAGWISFSCENTDSCESADYSVTINPATGEFSGQAWGENIGWISFASTEPVVFAVQTSWRGDADGDGIADLIDMVPPNFSDDFMNTATTSGTITNRGNQILTITDEPDPDGVRITADPAGGDTPATVSVCGGSSIVTLSPGDEVVETCSSVEIKVISGQVEITFVADDGTLATTSLVKGSSLIFEPTTLTFTAPESNSEPIVVLVEGTEISLEPGESKTFVIEANVLKESAIGALSALISTGDNKTDKRIKKALKHLEKSLDPKLWETDSTLTKKGKKVFDEEKKAVKDLQKLIKDKKVADDVKDVCENVIDELLTADKLLAETALNEAKEYEDPDRKVDKEIEKSEKELEKAIKELEKGKPDKAIDHYKKACPESNEVAVQA